MTNTSRVSKGVPTGGQFAASAKSESGVSLGAVTDRPYADSTPVEIDTELARLYGEHGTEMARYEQAMGHVIGSVGRSLGRGWRATASRDEVETWVADKRAVLASGEHLHPNDKTTLGQYDKAQDHLAKADDLDEQMKPLNDEFRARGGWTRAFLVTNQNGHVHSSMDCSTCFQPGFDNSGNWRTGTRYHWVTELSDATEDEVVKAAGRDACSVCYPAAKALDLARERTIFTPDEVDKQKAKAEREQAKADRLAKKIANGLTDDGSEFEVAYPDTKYRFVDNPDDPTGGTRIREAYEGATTESFKTERAAVQWMVQYMSWGGENQPDRTPAYDAIIEAVAKKHDKSIDEVRADIDKKVKDKRKRDGW